MQADTKYFVVSIFIRSSSDNEPATAWFRCHLGGQEYTEDYAVMDLLVWDQSAPLPQLKTDASEQLSKNIAWVGWQLLS